jgi:hypothetical protein
LNDFVPDSEFEKHAFERRKIGSAEPKYHKLATRHLMSDASVWHLQ